MKSNLLDATGLGLCVIALVLAYLRWLRVAQREHYLPGSASRFARRWWGAGPLNRCSAAGAAGAVVSVWYPPAAFAAALAAAAGPVGLTLRGRTSKLAWTARLRRLAGVSVVLAAVPIAGAGCRRVARRLYCGRTVRHGGAGPRRRGSFAHEMAGGPVASALRATGEPASGVGQAPRRGYYRFLRQDDDEGIRSPPGCRQHNCGRQPGKFQQYGGVGPGHKRTFGYGDKGFRGGNGHVRAGGNSSHVQCGPPRK